MKDLSMKYEKATFNTKLDITGFALNYHICIL